eukprot:scaffold385116_cov86-Attheya_sp.AAC.2
MMGQTLHMTKDIFSINNGRPYTERQKRGGCQSAGAAFPSIIIISTNSYCESEESPTSKTFLMRRIQDNKRKVGGWRWCGGSGDIFQAGNNDFDAGIIIMLSL